MLYVLFCLSGFTGLVYEITWSRVLATIFGSTSLAIAIVVSIFLSGLALGSWISSTRLFSSKRPLFLYAILEGWIAVYSLLTPRMAIWIDALYSSIHYSPHNFL